MSTTERDYADMVNPFVRAEEEAHSRGFREGFGAGIFATALILVFAAALLFYRLEARATEVVRYRPAATPIRASDVDARITVCQQFHEIERKWRCWGFQ